MKNILNFLRPGWNIMTAITGKNIMEKCRFTFPWNFLIPLHPLQNLSILIQHGNMQNIYLHLSTMYNIDRTKSSNLDCNM